DAVPVTATRWMVQPVGGGFMMGPSITAGGAFGLTLQAQDDQGNLAADYNGSATASVLYGPNNAGALGGTATVQVVNGVATFTDLTLTTAGSYTVQVTGGSGTG